MTCIAINAIPQQSLWATPTSLTLCRCASPDDTRSGGDILFLVTETKVYSRQEAADPSVLKQVYGAGPVDGRGSQPTPDGLSHLTLITCTGDFVAGSYDRYLVVYATQASKR